MFNWARPPTLTTLGARYNVIYPRVGITSTPVIDLSTNTIYLVAKTVFYVLHEKLIQTWRDRIFALDLASLAVKDSAYVQESDTFSLLNKNRPGLLLLNGRVYVGYGAFNNEGTEPYHGLIFSFDARNLGNPPAVLDTLADSPNYYGVGIWQSGNGLASDGTNIYVNTGNAGGPDPFRPGKLDDSVLKLSADLQVVQSYTPPNVKCLDTSDLDLTSSGSVLFPGSNILLSGGKEGLFCVFSSYGQNIRTH
jgi:hypothetical protein